MTLQETANDNPTFAKAKQSAKTTTDDVLDAIVAQ
jgi:hypothetical protein